VPGANRYRNPDEGFACRLYPRTRNLLHSLNLPRDAITSSTNSNREMEEGLVA